VVWRDIESMDMKTSVQGREKWKYFPMCYLRLWNTISFLSYRALQEYNVLLFYTA